MTALRNMTALTHRAASWLAISATAALLLAGCASPTVGGSTTDSGAGSSSDVADAPAGNSSDACPTIADYEYFSDSSITKFPAAGAIFGDGTTIEFNGPADVVPLYTLYFVDTDGKVMQNSGGIFSQEQPPGVYLTDSLVFGDEANGRPGILELETVYDDGLVLDTPNPDYVAGSSTVILGRYCLALKVTP